MKKLKYNLNDKVLIVDGTHVHCLYIHSVRIGGFNDELTLYEFKGKKGECFVFTRDEKDVFANIEEMTKRLTKLAEKALKHPGELHYNF